ncbi:MAG: CoA pyrophosphatase [Bosea sp. (in: a-proteobacteria)]
MNRALASVFPFSHFEALAGTGLRRAVPELGDLIARPRSDHDHQEHPVPSPDEASLKPAAVLVPVIKRPEGATVLLTLRAAALRDHSGQIAFPGGKIDEGDTSAVETALREAEEEIGLARAHVTPLGFLDAYLTGTGYRIVPVVAAVDPAFVLSINRGEVDEVFETPLSFLMDPANHQRHGREWKGVYRSYYAMPYGERYIWGATAGILRNLHDRLLGQSQKPVHMPEGLL